MRSVLRVLEEDAGFDAVHEQVHFVARAALANFKAVSLKIDSKFLKASRVTRRCRKETENYHFRQKNFNTFVRNKTDIARSAGFV